MNKFTISFLGRDCPGIVSAISTMLGNFGCNIEAMSQTSVCGEFAAIFVASAPDGTNESGLHDFLESGLKREKIDLSVLVRPATISKWNENLVCEPFVITAEGPDGPGLIGAMSKIMARHEVNIENLAAILNEEKKGHALFIFEVMVPESVDLGRLRRELACEAKKLNLLVSVQHRKIFEAVQRISSF